MRLLLIDPHFGQKSPSMKSIVRAIMEGELDDVFTSIEVWGYDTEVDLPLVKFRKFKKPPGPWFLKMLYFIVVAHWRYIWEYFIIKKKRYDIVQTTDYFCIFADIIYVHFCYRRYNEVVNEFRDIIRLTKVRKLLLWLNVIIEKWLFKIAKPTEWWTVSESMVSQLTISMGEKCNIILMPNAYDSARFNLKKREDLYDSTRSELGIKSDDIVIGYSSLGGFERKGLRLVLNVLEELKCRRLPVKLLLVGGPERDIYQEIQKYSESPIDENSIICTGRVVDTEKFFSAFDCFLFPSYCESFCLVLIEVVELGIRIYPAAFDGHEMTLVEGGNGHVVPWQTGGIVDIMMNDIENNKLRQCEGEHKVPNKVEFGKMLRARYSKFD